MLFIKIGLNNLPQDIPSITTAPPYQNVIDSIISNVTMIKPEEIIAQKLNNNIQDNDSVITPDSTPPISPLIDNTATQNYSIYTLFRITTR